MSETTMRRRLALRLLTALSMSVAAVGLTVPAAVAEETAAPAAEAATEAEAPVPIRAEVRGPRSVWASVYTGDRPLDPSAYRLTTASGEVVPISAVLPQTATATLIVPAKDIDITRVHYLEVPGQELRTRVRFDGWFRTLYSDKPLGAEIAADGSGTDFRIFAPRAERVRLFLYQGKDDTAEQATTVIPMRKDENGVWEASVQGDLHGTWYDFTVHGPADPGNHFYEANPVHISDPYARVNDDAQGKSRVWRPTTPATPIKGGIPEMEDVIAYEVHVQDFADTLPVAPELIGTMPAFAMPGLKNSRGEAIGFDYLADLGINVVHLLPMQEFLHYPDDEWAAAFADDPFMVEQGVGTENYQWGYRTTHAFAIENRFRKRGTDHGMEREQFRDMVQAFHDRGIAVIIDLVPNHTGENMDSRDMFFNFNVLDKEYYYRLDDAGNHIGPFGNEVKTEDRPMVQRWLIDQAKALIAEFGIDGFRIDLAGQLDEQSLIRLREELGPDIIIYGEPWIDVTDPYIHANPDWDWYKADAPITFFQDDARNAWQGSPFILENPATDRGYAGGNETLRAQAMAALENSFPEEVADVTKGIGYVDIHDNWALADRFALTDWDGRKGVDQGPYKVAAGLLLTSVGPVVIHGGSEMMRSKAHSPIIHEEKAGPGGGPIYIKGRDDTYNLRTANHFTWEDVGRTDGPNDYADMIAWWKGLIALRNSEWGEVFRIGGPVREGHYRFITPEDRHLLGYVVGEKVFVLTNVGEGEGRFDGVTLPAGSWRQVADGQTVNLDGFPAGALRGGRSLDLTVPATSMKIWVRE